MMALSNLTKNRAFPYLLILFIWLVALATKLHTHGLVYGLDYGLFHPDGTLYTFRSLTWLGKSQAEAGLEISNWYSSHASKRTEFSPSSLYFENNPGWAIYSLRYLYPFLSLPFVALIGVPGMLVVPAFSMLILMLCTYEITRHFRIGNFGILLVVFLSASITVNRWMFINTADPLLTALVAVALVVYIKRDHLIHWQAMLYLLVFLSSMTRFALFLWVALGLVLFLKRERVVATIVALIAILTFLPTLFVDFAPSVLANKSDLPILSKVLAFPISLFRVAFFEIAQLVVLDRLLIFFLFCVTIVALSRRRSESSIFFFAALISLWFTGAINGVIGVNFRYQLPIIPFAIWVLAENQKYLIASFKGYRLPKFR
jgi:hypothetical protein